MALTPAELLEKALNGESLDDDHADEATKTTTTPEEPTDNNTDDAADAAKAGADEQGVPHSLSEIAGEQHQDIAQQVMASAGTDPNALIERMQDMSPEQIERVMNAI
ncbi:hypothetical protein [Acidovorax sp.]|uniref:hypothetical protein n=1 Tax=Acidovorax sp. TaxID=1872122 RepID=UPI0025C41A33|nr:hypothetical protein [Acidovorax sp.]MBL7089930.1 hypothetical protein [Acidovorax sp.]